MEHGKKIKKFGRETKQRSALMRSLAISLIERGKIRTTTAKAKSLRVFIDKLVTRARKNDLSAIKHLSSLIGIKATNKLVKEILPKFIERKGGYARVYRLGQRISDGAETAIIEFIS